MSGLFEHLAANDEMGRIARRKAIAVANKRVADRFGEFLTDSDAETVTERLDLVGEEFDNAIRDACDEQGVEDHEPIIASVRSSFLKKKLANGGFPNEDPNSPDYDEQAESRRHREESDMRSEELNSIDPLSSGTGEHFCPGCGSGHTDAKTEGNRIELHCKQCGQDFVGEMEPDQGMPEDVFPDDPDYGFDEPPPHPRQERVPPPREGSVKEARRPKMCPYHKELVNASLQVGEPQYAAFAPLVGGDSHCGGGYEDKCNFKPPMVAQSYWDQKETDRLERKEQRELAQQGEQSHELEAPMVEETFDEPTDQATLAELDDAPSAVGDWEVSMDSVEAESPEPVLASSRWEITAMEEEDDEVPEMLDITPNQEGILRWMKAMPTEQAYNMLRSVYLIGGKEEKEYAEAMASDLGIDLGITPEDEDAKIHRQEFDQTQDEINDLPETEHPLGPHTGNKDGDSWEKNEKVEQPEGPSPKIDKKQWNGLEPIDTDAGPYKTVHQDVPDRPDYSKTDSLGQATKDAVLEYTKAVTTEETLPTADDNAGFNTDKNVDGAENTKTFPNKGQVDPVTPHTMSSTDALNMHTADLLGDIGDAAKDFGGSALNLVPGAAGANAAADAVGLPSLPNPVLDMAGDAVKGVANAAEGAGAAVNDYILDPAFREMPPESVLEGDPYGGNRPTGPDGKEISPEELRDIIGNPPPVEVSAPINKGGSITSAAHSVKEEDGKFFVIEDGDEKAAGPFASEEAAKKRANELNDMENLEKDSKKKEELTDSEKVNKELAEASDQIDDEVLGKLPNSKKAGPDGAGNLPLGPDEQYEQYVDHASDWRSVDLKSGDWVRVDGEFDATVAETLPDVDEVIVEGATGYAQTVPRGSCVPINLEDVDVEAWRAIQDEHDPR